MGDKIQLSLLTIDVTFVTRNKYITEFDAWRSNTFLSICAFLGIWSSWFLFIHCFQF